MFNKEVTIIINKNVENILKMWKIFLQDKSREKAKVSISFAAICELNIGYFMDNNSKLFAALHTFSTTSFSK